MKRNSTRHFSGLSFSVFGLDMERYSGKTENGKMYLSLLSPNMGKKRREKLQIWTLFTQYTSITEAQYSINFSKSKKKTLCKLAL